MSLRKLTTHAFFRRVFRRTTARPFQEQEDVGGGGEGVGGGGGRRPTAKISTSTTTTTTTLPPSKLTKHENLHLFILEKNVLKNCFKYSESMTNHF